MPKTKFQNVVFTFFMALVMVYAMICYNVSINVGGMSNQVFLMSLHELVIMFPIAFVLEFFMVDKLAHILAFKIVTPEDRPIVIILAISSMIVCIMCPLMSFIACILFKDAGTQFVAVWIETVIRNFPMAFFWQIFFAGPLVRFVFGQIFKKQLKD